MEVEVVKSGSEEDIWDVEDLERLEWKPKRKGMGEDVSACSGSILQKQSLISSISEFDPFYSPPRSSASVYSLPAPPAPTTRIQPKIKQPSIPIVNLPPPKLIPSRASLAPSSDNDTNANHERLDKAKPFLPHARVAIDQPTADISPSLLSDERMYAVIPVHLRGTKLDPSGEVNGSKEGKGRLGRMMDALDETRQSFTSPASTGPDVKHETGASFDPVSPLAFSLGSTFQSSTPSGTIPNRPVSTFGTPTSKITTPTTVPIRPGWVRSNAPSPASPLRKGNDETQDPLPAKPDWIQSTVPSPSVIQHEKKLLASPMHPFSTPPRTIRRDLPITPESPSERKGKGRMGLGLGRADEDGEVEYQGKVDDVVRGIIRGRQGSGEGAEIGSTRFLLINGVNRFIQPQAIKERVSKVAGIKALVYRYQKDLGIVLLLLHSPKDAIKIHHAIASGEIHLGVPRMRSLSSEEDDMLASTGTSLAMPLDAGEIVRLECHGLTAAGVYAIAGDPIRKYIDDCELTLKIKVETIVPEDSSAFLKSLLEELGTLRIFKKEARQPEIFSVEYEDSRYHEIVLRNLPTLWSDGTSLQVWPIPFENENIPGQLSTGDLGRYDPILPLSPPSTKRRQTDLPAREPSSPTPFRPFNHIDKLPITPPRTNQALERLLQGASPTEELLAAVKTEKSKWELYEQALLSTPCAPATSNLFRVAQYSSPGFKSSANTTPTSASKLVSFNSMKSPANINREELQQSPIPMKGQDSVRYKQEVPQNFRFSLERLQRGLDSRTTVMIKDIPNKLTRDQLIEAIHEVVPCGITFAYLRFDWEFQCNVAYGFVNFRSLEHLERFARERLGQKWGMFMSDKVLQMSYAFIQGHDALVNHFRNSTVMQTTPQWRPVVLDSKGNIDEFPEPNRLRHGGGSGTAYQRYNQDSSTYDWQAAEPCSL